MFSLHTDYRGVDLDDPNNVRFTPDVNGQPGNVTYVWAPTKVLPLVAWAGPLAPALDNALRPIVEKGYHRPVDIPDPTPPATASKRTPTKVAKPAAKPKPKSSTASSARRK